jgi:hypothetical protein
MRLTWSKRARLILAWGLGLYLANMFVRRFQGALNEIQQTRKVVWADIATECWLLRSSPLHSRFQGILRNYPRRVSGRVPGGAKLCADPRAR